MNKRAEKKAQKKQEDKSTALVTTKDKVSELMLVLFFMVMSFIVMIPILNVIAVSLSSKEAILLGKVTVLPAQFTLEAYQQIFKNVSFLSSFAFSIILTLAYTLVSMLMTILCAYPLSKSNLKGKKVLMVFIIITMYFNPGIIPNYLTMKNLGLLDSVWVLILPTMLSAYNMIILKSFFEGIDSGLYEAAYLDGASEMTILMKIVLPLTGPAIATLSLFYAVSRWNGVSDVMFYVNDPKYYTVQLKLKQMMDNIVISSMEADSSLVHMVTPENLKSASIVISMIPMLLAYPFVQKYFTKGITLGSVKG